jgi:hypothetical protein
MFESFGRVIDHRTSIDIGPFILRQAQSAAMVFDSMEREIWRGFGIASVETRGFQPERGLATLTDTMRRNGA